MKTYHKSVVGKGHLFLQVECQDYSHIEELTDGSYIMAVGDGLGSCLHSATASKTGCLESARLFKLCLPDDHDPQRIMNTIEVALTYALGQIARVSRENQHKIEEYDTTLMIVYFDHGNVYYGYTGDGAIFILDSDGFYKKITHVEKGNDECSVYPLRSNRDHWQVGQCQEDVVSLLVVTDGILDAIHPYELEKDFEDTQFNTVLLNAFMHPSIEGDPTDYIENKEVNGEPVIKLYKSFNNQDEDEESILHAMKLLEDVSDDKTIACIVDETRQVDIKNKQAKWIKEDVE